MPGLHRIQRISVICVTAGRAGFAPLTCCCACASAVGGGADLQAIWQTEPLKTYCPAPHQKSAKKIPLVPSTARRIPFGPAGRRLLIVAKQKRPGEGNCCWVAARG
jgi:hypothetical protein